MGCEGAARDRPQFRGTEYHRDPVTLREALHYPEVCVCGGYRGTEYHRDPVTLREALHYPEVGRGWVGGVVATRRVLGVVLPP